MNNYGNAILFIAQYSNRPLTELFRMSPADLQTEVQTIIADNTAAVDEINRIIPVINGWAAAAANPTDELNTCPGFDNNEITTLNTQLDNYHLFHVDEHTTAEQWNEYANTLNGRFEHFNDELNANYTALTDPNAVYNQPLNDVDEALNFYERNLTDDEKELPLEDAHDAMVQRHSNDVRELNDKINAIDSIIDPRRESTNYQDREASYTNEEVPDSQMLNDLIDALTDDERSELESHRNPSGRYTYGTLEDFRNNNLQPHLAREVAYLSGARRVHDCMYRNSQDDLQRTYNEIRTPQQTQQNQQAQANPAREWAALAGGICAGFALRAVAVATGINPIADVVVTGYGVARNIYNGFIRDRVNHDNAIVRVADTVFGPSQHRTLGKFIDGVTLGWSVSKLANCVTDMIKPDVPPVDPVNPVPVDPVNPVPVDPIVPNTPAHTLSTTGISGYFDSYGSGPVDLIDGINGQLAETNNGFQLLREVGTNTPIAWLSPEQVAQATQTAAGALTKTL